MKLSTVKRCGALFYSLCVAFFVVVGVCFGDMLECEFRSLWGRFGSQNRISIRICDLLMFVGFPFVLQRF